MGETAGHRAAGETVPRPMAMLAEAMTAALLEFGSRTGLAAALGAGPADVAELSRRAGGDARMTEEWLRGLVAAGFATRTDAGYTWAPEAVAWFGTPGGPADLQPGLALSGALTRCVPAAADAFPLGGVLESERYPRELADAMQRMSTQWTTFLLPGIWLPAVPGLTDALRAGGRVAEIGCASGETLESLATTFPRITAEGFDLDERLTKTGNARLSEHGLADRVVLRPVDAATGMTGHYDLVLALSVLHDATDPPALMRAAASALRPSGCLLVVESPPVSGPLAAMLLTTSLLYCVPTTAARGGRPLGTLGLPPEALLPLAEEAGLRPVPDLPAVHPLVAASAFRRPDAVTRPAPVPLPETGRLPRAGRGRIGARALHLTARTGLAAARLGPLWTADRLRGGRAAAQVRLARRIVRVLERLGPAYVKFGQMLASRVDLFPAEVTEQLGTLHDDVTPMADAEFRRQLALAGRQQPNLRRLRMTGRRLGSGSIACVYEAIEPDGNPVAVKLQREGVAESMSVDLALMSSVTRRAERLPAAGGAPLADLVGYLGRALYGQIDFVREAACTRRLAANLAHHPGIVVPRVRDEYTCGAALVTDLVDGLTGGSPPELGAAVRDDAASRALSAVGAMIFRDGFVHCDLHPGNIYVRQDGSVVMLDAGYSVEIPEAVGRALRDFFVNLALRNGTRCGEVMYDSAFPGGPPPRHSAADRTAFAAEIADLVRAATADRFDMTDFGPKVFESQKKFGVHPPADFAFPLMSLMIVEGTLRRWWPGLQIPAATGLG
ncbi:AarF/UbiB family protein [Amycolatopsis vastitatis]|uniref:Protein kinase domain-containing protein n=1 Tax=Amycolatopsis vastitatis TaxID=1905142 RepID=A0A229T4P8_9PSEU|nr:AarF/UbiB family protein [Amycolatopsis vastitatis]OXM65904.1 hypothetical protein CF165_21200 [Amycolatopsis vastitatis]